MFASLDHTAPVKVWQSWNVKLTFMYKWSAYYHYYSYGVIAPSLIVLFSPPLTHSVGRISLNSNLALSQISKERGELLWGNYYYIYYILNTITIYTILLYILKLLYLSFFILWQSIYHSWHAIHWGGMEEYNSEWLRGMHFCYSQYQTS